MFAVFRHSVRLSCVILAAGFFVWQAAPAFAADRVGTNDTFLPKQWYLDSIHAREGWMASTGSADVVVALIDTAVDIDHPDIKPNLWVNDQEIAGNGKDDDGDGYVDDVNGWNFLSASGTVKPKVASDNLREAFMHGTAVASLIAAAGNNDIGISGVAWRAKLMPLVALSQDGYGRDQDVIAAIRYAVAHGADIINLSFMGSEFDRSLADAIREATSQGVLVVSAAGNGEKKAGDDLDALPSYPACDKGAAGRGSLTVSGLTSAGQKANYANFGSCVDVSAPGSDIFAARPTYDRETGSPAAGYVGGLSGTSVAAPLVSGLAVLLKSRHPYWTANEIAGRIIGTADPLSGLPAELSGKMGSGKINVARALADDEASSRLGPLFLEASGPGQSPEVRVMDVNGRELHRFMVGEQGDRRGIRAAFVRWSGGNEPEIAVASLDDGSGSWRIYRNDGVLIAAGSVGSGVQGSVYLAAQDLDGIGRDALFLGEADGRRAWLVSADNQRAKEVGLPKAAGNRGISALSVSRPAPAFLVTAKFGGGAVAVIGKDGIQLATGQTITTSNTKGWINRRAISRKAGQVYDILSADGRMVFVRDAVGLRLAKTSIPVERWVQVPDGEIRPEGWRYYEAWPR